MISKDLTRGNLWKQILFFGVPLILSNMLQVLFNMSDIAVVGNFAGPTALGSVGSTTILVALFTGILIGLSNGVNVLVARFFGAKDDYNLERTVQTAFFIMLIAGVINMVIGLLLSESMLILLGTKEELLPGAELYMHIYFTGMPALGIYNFGNAVFSAIGNTKKPLLYLFASGVINVILNLFFVIVCGMGVAGVALASSLSQYISAVLILVSLLRADGAYKLVIGFKNVTKEKIKNILALGIPASAQNVIFYVANLFVQAGVNTFDTVYVNGNSAAANSDALVYDAMAGFYTACSSFMGQNFGVRDKKRMLGSYLISLLYSFILGVIMGALLLIFGTQFLSLFTNEPEIISTGWLRLKVMAYSYCVSAFMDCAIAASRGIGKTLVPTIIVISGSCVFRIIWIYTVFAHFKTIGSLYLLYPCSWILTAIAETIYFFVVFKKIVPAERKPETDSPVADGKA